MSISELLYNSLSPVLDKDRAFYRKMHDKHKGAESLSREEYEDLMYNDGGYDAYHNILISEQRRNLFEESASKLCLNPNQFGRWADAKFQAEDLSEWEPKK